MYNILVVDDDKEIVESIEIFLRNEGYNVYKAYNGIEALDVLVNKEVHLILMDIMMPKLDGIKATIKIREEKNIPIILISAKSEDTDKIMGLNIGADDYITKPFNPMEIVARVNSNLRRFYHFNKTIVEKEETQLIVGDLTLDTQKLALFKRGEEVIVTPTEYKILALLMKTPGKVYTKLQMCEAINGDYIESDNNTMMVHVSRLREKVEDDSKNPEYIKTVRGIGYKIEKK